jgi:surface antigen Omp85-like protein
VFAAGCLALLLASGSARAKEPEPTSASREIPPKSAVKTKPVPADQARNYEREPGTEPEDVALFVPRLVLAVPRYALKVVLFPVREGIEFLDRHAVVERVTDVLYNDARTGAILPTVSVDSTFGPSFGVKAFHRDLAGHDEYGSAEARFGGMYKLASQLHFRADHFGGTRLWLESVARFEGEPGLLFQGIGQAGTDQSGSGLDPRAAAVKTRYSEDRWLALFRAGYTLGRPGSMLQVGASAIYNVRSFGAKQRGSGASIEQVYDTSRLVGFNDRVATLETDLNLIIDFRDVAGATSNGMYLELFGGRVPRIGDYGFWHHGAELTGYIDLYKRTRVLVLRGFVEGVEGKNADIPFTDLPRLGGPSRLRGYSLDRFRDEKAAVGTLEYHYPIHQFVAGSLYADVGRVGRSYEDFFQSGWRAGFGGGFIVRSRDHQLFTFDIAYGDKIQFYVTTDPLRAFSKRDTEL